MKKNYILGGLINAGITATYITLLVSFMWNIETIFDNPNQEDTVLIPIFMLILFVTSAAITSSAVFGRPILWYLDGKKKEALKLLGYTLLFLILIAAILFSILL